MSNGEIVFHRGIRLIRETMKKVDEKPSMAMKGDKFVGGVIGEYTDTGKKNKHNHKIKIFFPKVDEAPKEIKIYWKMEVDENGGE